MDDETLPVSELTLDTLSKQIVALFIAEVANDRGRRWRYTGRVLEQAAQLPQELRDRIGTTPEVSDCEPDVFKPLMNVLSNMAASISERSDPGRWYQVTAQLFQSRIIVQVPPYMWAESEPYLQFRDEHWFTGEEEESSD